MATCCGLNDKRKHTNSEKARLIGFPINIKMPERGASDYRNT